MKASAYKTYKIYGREKGNGEAKSRYLFSTLALNQSRAIKQARRRVKGAYTITKVVAQR